MHYSYDLSRVIMKTKSRQNGFEIQHYEDRRVYFFPEEFPITIFRRSNKLPLVGGDVPIARNHAAHWLGQRRRNTNS